MNEAIRENWGKPGMPPKIVEVVHKQILFERGDVKLEQVLILGHHVHLGQILQGWRGGETSVLRQTDATGQTRTIKLNLIEKYKQLVQL